MRTISFRDLVSQLFHLPYSQGWRTRRRRPETTPAAVQTLEDRALLASPVKDINPGAGSGLVFDTTSFFLEDKYLTNVNGTLFFAATSSSSQGLWKSNGTATGTVLVKELRIDVYDQRTREGSPDLSAAMINVNGTLYFQGNDGVNGVELWKSDGTSSGTVMVSDISTGASDSFPRNMTIVNGTLFFTKGRQGPLWKTDGTSSGTVLVRNVFADQLATVNGTLYFRGDDGSTGAELWKSDGTEAGTVMVKDIQSGSYSWGPKSGSPGGLTNINGTLYFAAINGTNGVELWKSNGTPSGTVMVRDIRPGNGSSYPAQLTNVNGTLFFRADDGTNGSELWKSDGTEGGTVLVSDIQSGGNGTPDYLTNVNGTLFFRANDGTTGEELWKSDGTSDGTVLVKDVSSSGNSYPQAMRNVNGTLYFAASDGNSGFELWKSDGTAEGTVLALDVAPGSFGSLPRSLTPINGKLFFIAATPSTGRELFMVVTQQNQAPTDLALSATAILENQSPGTTVGTFTTTDPDAADTFTYTLVSGDGSADNASFTIDGATLKTAASFDFETQSSYSIRVRTTDPGAETFEKQFTITVSNVNETPTNLTLSASSIAENQPVGTTVGVFTATDPDAGTTLTYSLVSGAGDADNASFTIDGNTLKTAASFDFETQSSYSIRAAVSDGTLTSEQQFTITVTDGNDGATQVALSNVVTSLLATANTSSAIPLADVSVTDDGLGTNTFSVSGADAGVFEVVANQLRLKAGTVLNYATQNTFAVTVNVDDTTVGGTPDASVDYTLSLQGLDATIVQNGSASRSYVRYVALTFGTSQGLAEAVSSIGTATPRMSLTFAGTTGTQSLARSLTSRVSVVGAEVRIDFGVNGVGGDRNSSLGDGVYRLRLDLDGDGTVDVNAKFFRLFGDVDGNGLVNDTDIGLVQTAQGQAGGNLATDLNGDGLVNLTDLTNVKRRKGAKVYWP